jgi:NodT family efflux transporter outer membrane factor (OMF) lipoprotein
MWYTESKNMVNNCSSGNKWTSLLKQGKHSKAMYRIKAINISLAGIMLNGCCSVGPKYDPPSVEMNCEWHSQLSEGMQNDSPDYFVWWEALNDPILNSLIFRASQQNLDMKIAALRVLQARSYYEGKKGNLYPHVDASASGGHLYYSKDALLNGVLAGSNPCGNIHRNVNFFELGFDVEWEIDMFGYTRRQIKALEALSEAEEDAFCDSWITLSAEIAKNYIQLREQQLRKLIAQNQVDTQQEILALTKDLVSVGLQTADLSLMAEQQLSVLSAEIPLIDLTIDKSIHRLSILLGLMPEELFSELSCYQELPVLPMEKPVGVPSEILRRRPDIRKAEREFAAATEYTGSAIAALFPRFSLRGFIGDISTQLPHLFNPSSGTWFLQPQLLMPIFNSRMLQEDVKDKKLKAEEACNQYQKTVLLALEEVENAIASFHYELNRHYLLETALESAEKTQAITADLFQRGLKDYIEVLKTNRAVLSAKEIYAESQIALLMHYISLYKSLGGGCDLTCQES